ARPRRGLGLLAWDAPARGARAGAPAPAAAAAPRRAVHRPRPGLGGRTRAAPSRRAGPRRAHRPGHARPGCRGRPADPRALSSRRAAGSASVRRGVASRALSLGRCLGMSGFFRVAWLVVRKDLMVEARSFEIITTTLFFAVTVVLVFAFGLVREGRAVDDVAAAILWIALAFSGTLAL